MFRMTSRDLAAVFNGCTSTCVTYAYMSELCLEFRLHLWFCVKVYTHLHTRWNNGKKVQRQTVSDRNKQKKSNWYCKWNILVWPISGGSHWGLVNDLLTSTVYMRVLLMSNRFSVPTVSLEHAEVSAAAELVKFKWRKSQRTPTADGGNCICSHTHTHTHWFWYWKKVMVSYLIKHSRMAHYYRFLPHHSR